MQADDAIQGRTSLNLKCYKTLDYTVLWQRSRQFLLFFKSLNSKRKKRTHICSQAIYLTMSDGTHSPMPTNTSMVEPIKTVS